MDLYELKDHATHFFGEGTTVELDMRCRHQIEVISTPDGEYQAVAFVEYRRAKIVREGGDPVYVPIAPHRENIALVDVASHIAAAPSYALGAHTYEGLRLGLYKGENIDGAVAQYAILSKQTPQQVRSRIDAIPMRRVQPLEDLIAELLPLKDSDPVAYASARDAWIAEHEGSLASKIDELVEKLQPQV